MTCKETSDMLQALHYIRENPNDMKYYDTKNIPRVETLEYISCFWFPGCNIIVIIGEFLTDMLIITLGLITRLLSCVPVCNTIACPS